VNSPLATVQATWSREPQRGGMFIAREIRRRRKLRRSGVESDADHAAPPGLGRIIGGALTRNVWTLRSFASAEVCRETCAEPPRRLERTQGGAYAAEFPAATERRL
jgi:hypothetical protein